MVVARPADIGMQDRHAIAGRAGRRLAVELVVEDRAYRPVGQGADLDGPRCCGFEASRAEWPHQPDDAQAGAEALFRMRTTFEDQRSMVQST